MLPDPWRRNHRSTIKIDIRQHRPVPLQGRGIHLRGRRRLSNQGIHTNVIYRDPVKQQTIGLYGRNTPGRLIPTATRFNPPRTNRPTRLCRPNGVLTIPRGRLLSRQSPGRRRGHRLFPAKIPQQQTNYHRNRNNPPPAGNSKSRTTIARAPPPGRRIQLLFNTGPDTVGHIRYSDLLQLRSYQLLIWSDLIH